MATDKTSSSISSSNQTNSLTPISPQRLATDFVRLYYYFLGDFPVFVCQFYKDSSRLNWQGQDGVMTNLTTMEAIVDHFRSLLADGKKQIDILSCDVQESCDNGLFLVVIGRITSNKTKKFSQSFFLAAQETGYFVLNDVLRFLDDDDHRDPAPDQEIPTDDSYANQNNAASVAPPLQHIVDFLEGTSIFIGNLGAQAEYEGYRVSLKKLLIAKAILS